MAKKRVSITIDEETLEWAKKMVETRRYRNLSHLFEYAVLKLKEETEEK